MNEAMEARNALSSLAPFLSDKKSKLLLSCLDDAIRNVWSLAGDVSYFVSLYKTLMSDGVSQESMTSEVMALLLRDVAALLRVPAVEVVSKDQLAAENAENITSDFKVIRVLSDIALLEEMTRHDKSIVHKLKFYAAHVLSSPKHALNSLADTALKKAEVYDAQARSAKDDRTKRKPDRSEGREDDGNNAAKALVEEIP
jgi:hypothetical protein